MARALLVLSLALLFSRTAWAGDCVIPNPNDSLYSDPNPGFRRILLVGAGSPCTEKIEQAAKVLRDPTSGDAQRLKAAKEIKNAEQVLIAIAKAAGETPPSQAEIDEEGKEEPVDNPADQAGRMLPMKALRARDITIRGDILFLAKEIKAADAALAPPKNQASAQPGQDQGGEVTPPAQDQGAVQPNDKTPEPEQRSGPRKPLTKGDYARVEGMADEMINRSPEDPDIYSMRAWSRLSQGKNDAALADARKALDLDPGNEIAQQIVGYVHSAAGVAGKDLKKPDFGAMLDSESARYGPSGTPDRLNAQAGRSLSAQEKNQIGSPLGQAPLAPSQFAMRKAAEKMELRDFTGALIDATQAIDAEPRNPAAWTLRSEISNRMGHYAAAIKDANEALKLDPVNAQALRARAYAEYQTGDYAKAFQDADRAVELQPGNPVGYLYRAMAEEKLGEKEKAAADYLMAARLDVSLKPVADAALARLGVARRALQGLGLPRRALFRSGAIIFSLAMILLGLEGGRRLTTTLRNRRKRRPLGVPQDTLDSGTILGGNYQITRELGRGGMGVVYEAMDLALQRRVAIKQLQRDENTGPEDLDAFLREARVAALLKHPRLAEIYSVIEDWDLYLVFELLDGTTLAAKLEKAGRLAPEEARRILGDVCEAIDYAHSQKIVHRDLKPSNIMICPDGSAKVMDFGIAHQSRTLSGQTQTTVSGTPPYMAPEQAMGSASPASDIYSLGVLAYEIITGSRPFTGPDLLGDKLAERFPPASAANPALPKAIDAFFAAALKADPTKRFTGGQAIIKAMDSVLAAPV